MDCEDLAVSTKLVQPLKWHGGKAYLANKIIALMPPRCKNPNMPAADDPGWLHYVEPYFGGGSVLLANDPEGVSEVANDINGDLADFWQTMKAEHLFDLFLRRLQGTPFSSEEYIVSEAYLSETAPKHLITNWERSAYFFVRCRQSLSGRMKGFAGITRSRTRKGMNEQVSAWLNAVEGLPAVHARLKRVLILNKPALEVIRSEDGPRTLFYLDPPYLHETRATTGEYEHEMTRMDHLMLLKHLVEVKGRFLLSGYRSDLYDDYARNHGWKRHDFDLPNNAAGGKEKRRMTECVWTNY